MNSSARYHELWRVLRSVPELAHEIVVHPDLDSEAASPEDGFHLSFDQPNLPQRVTYIIDDGAAEVQSTIASPAKHVFSRSI